MNSKQRGTFDTLGNAQRFLDQHADRLGGVATNGGRKKLDVIAVALGSHRSDQSEGAMSAQTLVRTKVTARRALLQDHLGAIAAIARAELPHTPELAVVRRMPNASARVNTLLSRAEDVAKAVQPFADTFVANGLPADFLAQLVRATHSVSEIASTHTDSRVKVVAASSGIFTRSWQPAVVRCASSTNRFARRSTATSRCSTPGEPPSVSRT